MTTREIDSATDELNALFDAVSELLRRDFQGVYAEVPVTESSSLAFGNRDGVWGLHFIRDGKCVPLTSATREERIKCADYLVALRSALFVAKGDLSERVDQAKAKVKVFIATYPKEAP